MGTRPASSVEDLIRAAVTEHDLASMVFLTRRLVPPIASWLRKVVGLGGWLCGPTELESSLLIGQPGSGWAARNGALWGSRWQWTAASNRTLTIAEATVRRRLVERSVLIGNIGILRPARIDHHQSTAGISQRFQPLPEPWQRKHGAIRDAALTPTTGRNSHRSISSSAFTALPTRRIGFRRRSGSR